MILVFGGTTEGRKAVEVLEEAGTPFYYSTKGDGQKIDLVNGAHLAGEKDVPQMIDICREHNIRLIVDAAHPFAEELHRNLLFLARHISAPIIRYDRIYPPHDASLIWCKGWDDAVDKLEAHHIERLLALTGVNTIGRLQRFWKASDGGFSHEVWFRILNRRASRFLAMANHFPEDRLVYYESDDTASLISNLRPDAIITKESGLSGGFTEKIETARKAGLKVFVVERPEYPPHTPVPHDVHIVCVNGPHGLRRAVEQLLPEFFPLHSGLTTGTCAIAAAIAATIRLLKGDMPHHVPVILPDGETIDVPVTYGDGYAACTKEAGDDPDVTDGIEIRAVVGNASERCDAHTATLGSVANYTDSCTATLGSVAHYIEIRGGEGVGRFTLPGFDFPPGEAAINKGPREMIRQNLEAYGLPLKVTISVPRGEEIARRTFNPRLGIEGGISIIGVSGIVKPFSEEAFIDSIRKCMEVAKASGTDRVVINSGAKSERFLKDLYPTLPAQAFVQYGNYIGETLRMVADLNIANVTLGVMLGKAVKLAQGHLDTHSRKATMDLDFIRQLLREAGFLVGNASERCEIVVNASERCDINLNNITLARELWEQIPSDRIDDFTAVVIRHCREHCVPLLPHGSLTILLIDDNGKIYESE